MGIGQMAIVLAHAFVGWALCGATMGIGMGVASIENALIIHAVSAPIFFTAVSLSYFRWFNFTGPASTAVFFLSFVIIMDFTLVALLTNKSLAMFAGLLGTWIPFALIFMSTYFSGLLINREAETA